MIACCTHINCNIPFAKLSSFTLMITTFQILDGLSLSSKMIYLYTKASHLFMNDDFSDTYNDLIQMTIIPFHTHHDHFEFIMIVIPSIIFRTDNEHIFSNA